MHKQHTRELITARVQQRPESPTVTLTWHACKYKVRKTPPEVHPLSAEERVFSMHKVSLCVQLSCELKTEILTRKLSQNYSLWAVRPLRGLYLGSYAQG